MKKRYKFTIYDRKTKRSEEFLADDFTAKFTNLLGLWEMSIVAYFITGGKAHKKKKPKK